MSEGGNEIYLLFNKKGDNNIRLKMLKRGVNDIPIEDREKLIVDRDDGTNFNDFYCKFAEGEIHCVFCNEGPFFYKAKYVKNRFAGLISKKRSKYYNYLDIRPISVHFNDKFIAIIGVSAETSLPRLLIYRDKQKGGSKYLYAGVNLEEFSDRNPHKIKVQVSDEDYVFVTVNQGESLVKKFKISDFVLTPSSEPLQELKRSAVIFNGGNSGAPEVKIPLSFFYLKRSEQIEVFFDAAMSFKHWLVLLFLLTVIVMIVGWIQNRVLRMKKEIKDSGIRVSQLPKEKKLLVD